ncbi:hypothetical protein INR77_06770 [Erythrobacter sp. SCSIO 43205]|uniref:hypothetical protein n=1 Tax=Erythrobacter sp. SCSIO 43205 TaxID=2779361 RepID=UPI001CA88954|nr:hypothetical protein [Erythrobacter sp. SCSIO 43205]UAB79374.1 hypothetical protein INR77_06770 [Erythrobacter sp. SCSIO 43205]
MPSIDGGYYFLTVLVPVRKAWPVGPDDDGKYPKAPIIELREKLAQMPTAMQTPFSHDSGEISNFSKSTRTHLARFAVIDRLGYNGFQAADPVLDKLGLAKPINNRSELSHPYLLFAAEFDAPSGSRSYDLAVYLRELWDVMQDDLVDIFSNCVAFEPDEITTAADFIAYIKQCEIETTMPFNFYWMDMPTLPTLTKGGLAAGSLITGALAGGLAGWGVTSLLEWVLGPSFDLLPIVLGVIAGIIAFLIGAIGFIGFRFKQYGDRPFPSPPDADLVSVLKGLHLQTTFGHFVVDNQAKDADVLHKAFGVYLDENKPQKSTPRHPAGRVYS